MDKKCNIHGNIKECLRVLNKDGNVMIIAFAIKHQKIETKCIELIRNYASAITDGHAVVTISHG